MSRRKPDEILQFFMKMIADEQCIVIRPHMSEFRVVERDFLEGLRRIPAAIVAPPGRNPYSYVLGQQGSWLMIWVPE
jgi:hypothetical protein